MEAASGTEMPFAAFIVFVGKWPRLQTKTSELQTKVGYGINSRLFCTPKTKQQAIMTKFEKLMPMSHIVKAFCKAMKSLIEDEVVANDMECQLKTEMMRVSEEIPDYFEIATFKAIQSNR